MLIKIDFFCSVIFHCLLLCHDSISSFILFNIFHLMHVKGHIFDCSFFAVIAHRIIFHPPHT